ncbi:MAG: Periplasmic binding protein domain [Frankiaceae bacterium]|jgi:ABC-type sugar transport system substrate-binding protein|nr:Periplasmic binding protein domain [Frankiaceae bacterium]
MVRSGASQRLLSLLLGSLLVIGGCGAGSPGSPHRSASAAANVIALVPSERGSFAGDLDAVVETLARVRGFTVRAFTPATGSLADQIEQLGLAIAAHPRAIILDPLSYPALVPYLRAAHDAQIPVVVLQTTESQPNPAYVATFVGADTRTLTRATVSAVAEVLARGEIRAVVVSEQASSPRRARFVEALSGRLPGATVESLALPADLTKLRAALHGAGSPTAVIALDGVATQALLAELAAGGARRPKIVVSPFDSAAAEMLRHSYADVAVGPDVCAMASAAVDAAAKAAEHDVAALKPSLAVPVRVVTASRRAGFPCGAVSGG